MPSRSLKHWNETAALALDCMEAAHRAAAGTGQGIRSIRQQINQSYLMLLSSHFQQFCRELHSEAVAHLTGQLDAALHSVVSGAFTLGRKLDQGNPNPSNLGADFGRLGIKFWSIVTASYVQGGRRQDRLAKMSYWRNAIAHRDFTSATHVHELRGRTEITLQEVRGFRSNCNRLAHWFDAVVLAYIKTVAGPRAGW